MTAIYHGDDLCLWGRLDGAPSAIPLSGRVSYADARDMIADYEARPELLAAAVWQQVTPETQNYWAVSYYRASQVFARSVDYSSDLKEFCVHEFNRIGQKIRSVRVEECYLPTSIASAARLCAPLRSVTVPL